MGACVTVGQGGTGAYGFEVIYTGIFHLFVYFKAFQGLCDMRDSISVDVLAGKGGHWVIRIRGHFKEYFLLIHVF